MAVFGADPAEEVFRCEVDELEAVQLILVEARLLVESLFLNLGEAAHTADKLDNTCVW